MQRKNGSWTILALTCVVVSVIAGIYMGFAHSSEQLCQRAQNRGREAVPFYYSKYLLHDRRAYENELRSDFLRVEVERVDRNFYAKRRATLGRAFM